MASSAEYNRHHSSSILNPSLSLEEQEIFIIDDCHMLEAQLSNPRKRQRLETPSEQHSPQSNKTAQLPLKKRRLNRSYGGARSRTPAAFYDNLSKIWLTKHALRELDRRNAQPTPSSPCQSRRQTHKPFTHYAPAELHDRSPSTQTAPDFLYHCTPRCLKDIKQLARHGGPDLWDVRGVCVTEYQLASELTIFSSIQRLLALSIM